MRRPRAARRACGRRHDRPLRRLRPSSSARASRGSWSIGTDDTTSMLFRMKAGHVGLSRHDHHDRARLQLPGVRLQGLAAARRRDPCRRRLVGRAPHAAVRHLQIPADQGRRWKSGRPRRCDVTRACFEAFARAAEGGPAFPITPEQIIHGSSACEIDHPLGRVRQGRTGGLTLAVSAQEFTGVTDNGPR